jgi:hypothetical protein
MSTNKLTDTQLVLLSAAAQHPEGAIELASDLKGAAKKARGEVHIIPKTPPASPSPGEPDNDGNTPKVYTAPLPAPRPRARKEIIIPGGAASTARRLNHALILAIARAKAWMRDLRNGKYADTMDIARRFDLSDAHVRRVLRFGYLAPDLVEAIAEGRQPRILTVKLLLQGIPCAWPDQRAAFGLSR